MLAKSIGKGIMTLKTGSAEEGVPERIAKLEAEAEA